MPKREFFTSRQLRILVETSPTFDRFLENVAMFIIDRRLPAQTDTDQIVEFLNRLLESENLLTYWNLLHPAKPEGSN